MSTIDTTLSESISAFTMYRDVGRAFRFSLHWAGRFRQLVLFILSALIPSIGCVQRDTNMKEAMTCHRLKTLAEAVVICGKLGIDIQAVKSVEEFITLASKAGVLDGNANGDLSLDGWGNPFYWQFSTQDDGIQIVKIGSRNLRDLGRAPAEDYWIRVSLTRGKTPKIEESHPVSK